MPSRPSYLHSWAPRLDPIDATLMKQEPMKSFFEDRISQSTLTRSSTDNWIELLETKILRDDDLVCYFEQNYL
jgi:hypothetical protein